MENKDVIDTEYCIITEVKYCKINNISNSEITTPRILFVDFGLFDALIIFNESNNFYI